MHKSKLAFRVVTSTRNVRWSYIITCLVASIKATYSMAMNKITATKALTNQFIHNTDRLVAPILQALSYSTSLNLIRRTSTLHTHVHIETVGAGHENEQKTSARRLLPGVAWALRYSPHTHTRTHALVEELGRLLIMSVILTSVKNCFINISTTTLEPRSIFARRFCRLNASAYTKHVTQRIPCKLANPVTPDLPIGGARYEPRQRYQISRSRTVKVFLSPSRRM